ncbi:hypothetical protein V6N13_131661 [Hibiscus sabdariffa]|uniref:Membrane-associated kinase regulator 1 n=1 Tax=Hibiscus sabdariffa TaxID=183260 RepID=A0ABR2DBE6_9ROSI
MVRTLLLSSSSFTVTASRDSNNSHSSFASDLFLLAVDNYGSSRRSSVSKEKHKQVKKVKPLYEKLWHKQVEPVLALSSSTPVPDSSIRSSSSHSGVLSRNGFSMSTSRVGGGMQYSNQSSVKKLQSAIAHCKNSLHQNKTIVICKEF